VKHSSYVDKHKPGDGANFEVVSDKLNYQREYERIMFMDFVSIVQCFFFKTRRVGNWIYFPASGKKKVAPTLLGPSLDL
jgi:hypothetical protein